MDERRNASFKISDECSTSPHVESHDMEGVVDSTQLRFKILDCHRKYIMQKFGRLWRSHKSELLRKIRPLGKSAKLAQNIVLTKPDNVEMVEWKEKVQELHKASTDEGPKSVKDDVIFHTFGPEHRGSVQELGFGALPSKVDAQVHQNEHVRKLEDKVLDLEQQLDERRAMLIKERRQNYGTNPSQRSSDLLQSTPHDNLPTSVNEVGSVTESIEAMKLSKCAGSSISNFQLV
ncbi:hypothetical protein ACSBR1_023714 [Camellia fascicularis]